MQKAGDRHNGVDVHYDEMHKLTPDQIQGLFSWVLERVDLLSYWDSESSASKPIETLSFTHDGESIVPASAWKAHLRQTGRSSSTGNDAELDDNLLLDWVYGLVVPMREKAVEGAKRALFEGQAPDGVQLWALLKAVCSGSWVYGSFDLPHRCMHLYLTNYCVPSSCANWRALHCRRTGRMQSLLPPIPLGRPFFMKCLHVARKCRSS